MIKAVVFDLDDTLYPEAQFVTSGFDAVDSWLAAQEVMRDFSSYAMELFHQGRRGNIFNLVLDQLGIAYDDALIQSMVRVYREHEPTIEPFEDALSVLRDLSCHWLGLISDGFYISQRNKLNSLGLQTFFDFVVLTDQYGRDCWKPNPFAFKMIMEKTGFSAEEHVYVADNPGKDFVAPNALGWKTVQVKRLSGEYRDVKPPESGIPSQVVSSLLGLDGLVKFQHH